MRALLIASTLTVLLAMAVAIPGCAGGPPSEEPGISGSVTTVQAAGDSVVMLVEAPSGSSYPVGDKASVTIGPKTRAVDETGAKIDAASITAGTRVDVWFEGPVAESYPVQGTAGWVRAYQRGTVAPSAPGY